MFMLEKREVFSEKEMAGESGCVRGEMGCSNSQYDVWLRDLPSVRERRQSFLSKMGFVEPDTMELERVAESSGAVSSCDGSATEGVDDDLLSEREESKSEAHCPDEYSDQDWLDDLSIDAEQEFCDVVAGKDCEIRRTDKETKKLARWWRHLTQKMKKHQGDKPTKESKSSKWSRNRVRMEQSGKRCLECSAVYSGQEINAHNGLIWAMKFSPDGRYLASGGEDGLVCVWRVSSVDVAANTEKCRFGCPDEFKTNRPSIIVPEKAFHIEETPLHTFRGHKSDVLDLAWSSSNYLVSSSMDRTVRLWRVGSDECLGVFHHTNYVTCVQFNPSNEDYFISGSIDGKVRIWGVHTRRVKEWINARDIVSALSYQPNGKGFVVGSISGVCRFYDIVDEELQLTAELSFPGKKKSGGNRITCIQFIKNDARRLMITSEDSKIRILDGYEVVSKYKGSKKSGTQMSASFTQDGMHITSVGEDSHVYMWNCDDPRIETCKQARSINSYERFLSLGVSVAVTWSDFDMEENNSISSDSTVPSLDHSRAFSLASWFSMGGPSKGSMTWPEERLPSWDAPCAEHECRPCKDHGDHHLHRKSHHRFENSGSEITSRTWGLVFVTANCDGTIRTFHNYGLPVKT